jgi:uroporphyrinogen III methyltransferase/synthase
VNWSSVAGSETLVVFMGLHHLREIVESLTSAGRSPNTPAMAVQWATRPFQRTVVGTLSDIVARVENQRLTPPATIIIGEVVSLRERLSWFEKLPLFGRQVVVTRAREQSGDVVARLTELGAQAIEIPVIEMLPPADTWHIDVCLEKLGAYDWIVFTSANAVNFFMARVDDIRRLDARICAIGGATAEAVRSMRLQVDLIPDTATGEGVAAAFQSMNLFGLRVLFPRAEAARETVPAALLKLGAMVDAPVVYRNVVPADAQLRIEKYIASGAKPDWVMFTSPSTVNNFLAAGGGPLVANARIASIGPTTSEALRKHGVSVHLEPSTASTEAMIDGMATYEM